MQCKSQFARSGQISEFQIFAPRNAAPLHSTTRGGWPLRPRFPPPLYLTLRIKHVTHAWNDCDELNCWRSLSGVNGHGYRQASYHVTASSSTQQLLQLPVSCRYNIRADYVSADRYKATANHCWHTCICGYCDRG